MVYLATVYTARSEERQRQTNEIWTLSDGGVIMTGQKRNAR